MSPLPIVCSLPEPELRDRRQGLLARLATDRRLLDDGAWFEFPSSGEVTELLFQMLAAERPGTRELLQGTLHL